MSVKTEIHDGLGSNRTAGVTPSSALRVQVLPPSARGIEPSAVASLRQLREFFVNAAGSESQIVDGSTTPVEFRVAAAANVTKWVTGFRLIIQGQNCDLATQDFRRYAQTAAGLANGVEIETFQGGATANIAAAPIQILGEYLNYNGEFVNLTAAISPSVDYIRFDFAFATPVVLSVGSTDALIIRVNDDLTAALANADSAQYAIAAGYQESV
ncbi:MAG: hypothetical protein ACYTA3_10255 [Planctomycetota bacterium]|jgi:hypothetical protein